jgi:hypothetical protein
LDVITNPETSLKIIKTIADAVSNIPEEQRETLLYIAKKTINERISANIRPQVVKWISEIIKNGYLSPDHSVDSYLICLLNAFALKSNEFMDMSSSAISSAKGRFDPSIYLKELDELVEAAN